MINYLKPVIEEKIREKETIKLHLGCGPNILPNYVNVEGEYMKDNPNIVFHDITTLLPIPDNSVDEILTVHVIEHIMPYDIPEMINDWHRVLKPGGFVAVEWPDLYKMCKFIVDNPESLLSKKPKILKRGVAGIFGNISRYRDVAMLHKWGYSADSMIDLLNTHGFKNCKSEKNHHPKTNMCSRVVGFKL